MRRGIAPAKAHGRQTINFGKGAGHNHVLRFRNQFQPGRIIIFASIFRIGCIKYQDHIGRQTGVEAPNLVGGNVSSGRVVGVCQKYNFCARCDLGEDRVDVCSQACFFGDDRGAAGRQNSNLVNKKTMRCKNAFIAGAYIGIGDHREDLVRACAANDLRRVDAKEAPDDGAQVGRRAVRIKFQMCGSILIGGDSFWRSAKRGFVRRQFMNFPPGLGRAFSGHVGFNVHNAGAGNRAGC